MDEHEPEEQFEATDYDEDGNIKLPPPPLEAAKPKRPTVAGLKKDLDDLEEIISEDVYSWLDKLDNRFDKTDVEINETIPAQFHTLDTRLEALEATTATHNKVLLGDVKLRLDTLEEVSSKILPAFIDDMIKQCDNQDAAIGALADAVRSRTKEPAATPQQPETELEFAQPPQQTAGEHTRAGDIDVVASACQTMNDVLMITRVLKADQEILDEDRTYLLTIACRAAGVPLSGGLQIRAGVRNVEA